MHHVPTHVTAIFTVMLVAMILCLALEEKIHAKKSVIVGVFAIFIALFLFIVDFGLSEFVSRILGGK